MTSHTDPIRPFPFIALQIRVPSFGPLIEASSARNGR
jgi:hypothetical protein